MGLCPRPRVALPAEVLFERIKSTQKCAPQRGTELPLSSEVVLGYLLANDYNPAMSVSVATAGNVLGACLNYAIGLWGSGLFIRRILRTSEDEFAGAKKRFEKYGIASLLFAWVPIIGDPLTFAAGVLRINIAAFLVLVTAGKLIRYVVIGYAVL